MKEAGCVVDVVSPKGGDLEGDGCSDPEDVSGSSSDDIASLGLKKSPRHSSLLYGTCPIRHGQIADCDAILAIDGQGPIANGIDDAELHRVIAYKTDAMRLRR